MLRARYRKKGYCWPVNLRTLKHDSKESIEEKEIGYRNTGCFRDLSARYGCHQFLICSCNSLVLGSKCPQANFIHLTNPILNDNVERAQY
jgi:hypothetical protein